MVSLQSHYVKPLPNDLSETILTEHCKLETSLDENRVKNGHPLDFVLEEVGRIGVAKNVKIMSVVYAVEFFFNNQFALFSSQF